MRRLLPTSRLETLLDEPTIGLTSAEADSRRARYGTNHIVESPRSGWAPLLRDAARDPMIWFLAGTALLFAWLGDRAEAAVLAFALLPIAGMDIYLHRRTQASTEGLAGRLATHTRVLRDGVEVEVPSSELVPGDLIRVAEGSPIPADGLFVRGEALQVDESALTGEAMPVRKAPLSAAPAGGAEVAVDDSHWGFAGTRLLTGDARLRVVYTGPETLYGEIVHAAQVGRQTRTPLQAALGSLVRVLLSAAVVICIALAATRLYQGHGFVDAIVSALTLAVAALPEEFPVVFAFFLGVGVYRLAQRHALVRRAVVVENIGRVSYICSDKTGTLTEGRLRLAHVVPVEGVASERLLQAAANASRSNSGDPLDVAIGETAQPTAGTTLATFPFTEDRRREVAAVRTDAGTVLCAAKGAPETILAISRMTAEDSAAWLARTRQLASTGHKVIACAEQAIALGAWQGEEPTDGYVFLGALAFEDPIREGVAAAVAAAANAGIHVIMVTGDHPATAGAVAREIGLGASAPRIITGDELRPLLAREGAEGLRAVDVIARAVPMQKLDLVHALQGAREVVAVTGDGVNDVPALQAADVGIAMGERGTRTAREVASIVLLDDNFRTIVGAIAEGRQLFRNLRLSFAYLLMVHMPLVLTAALIPFAGFPLLYLPAHIVWLELIIHPTAVLGFQHAAPQGALEPRRSTAERRGFFDMREWLVIAAVGALLTIAVVMGYERSLGAAQDVEHARSIALAILVIGSATVTAGLSRLRGRTAYWIAAAAIVSAVVIVQIPPLARLLHVSPLHWDDWLTAAAAGLAAGSMSAFFARARAPTDVVR